MTESTAEALTSTATSSAYRLVVTRGVSSLGTGLTIFGLNIWVFQQTGSYQSFALLIAFVLLPGLLLVPLGGLIVDRCDKRQLLIGCEVGSLIALCFGLLVAVGGALDVLVASTVAVSLAICAALRFITLAAALPALVPVEQRRGVNGAQQVLQGLITISCPLLGALVLETAGLQFAFGIAVASTGIGLLGAWSLDGRLLGCAGAVTPIRLAEIRKEFVSAIGWVLARPLFRNTLLFFAGVNIAASVFSVSTIPFMLMLADRRSAAMCLAAQGLGIVVGALSTAAPGVASRLVPRIHRGAMAYGVVMVAWGIARDVPALTALAFSAGFATSFVMVNSQALWQMAPLDMQGRVQSLRVLVSYSAAPVAILASAPLLAYVLTPLLSWSPALQSLWGTAQPAPIGFMLSILGAMLTTCALLMSCRPRHGGDALSPPHDGPGVCLRTN